MGRRDDHQQSQLYSVHTGDRRRMATLGASATPLRSGIPVCRPRLIDASADPDQVDIANAEPIVKGEYTIYPRANFHVRARVLSAQRYTEDRAADLSPVDLALGWGRMADPTVLANMHVYQNNRWYYWNADRPPITFDEIKLHSNNMHMLPATPLISEGLIRGIHEGQLVSIEGYLVEVTAPDGWHWRSAMQRGQAGDGACSVVWVTKLEYCDR